MFPHSCGVNMMKKTIEEKRKRKREYMKKYRRRNKLYYELEKERTKKHSKHIKILLLHLLGKFYCEECNTRYSEGKYNSECSSLHIHFILPIEKGGKIHENNIKVLCAKCHGKTRRKNPV